MMSSQPNSELSVELPAAVGSGGLVALRRATMMRSADRSFRRRVEASRYVLSIVLLVAVGLLAMSEANRSFAPEMYGNSTPGEIGEVLARGSHYALFDLNVDIRNIRNAQIAALPSTPDLIVLGASHWQEAPAKLLPGNSMLNAHVHRDYYEDILGMVEMLVRHGKLPRQLLISIRDNQFTPVAMRRDHLWLPGIPYYRAMADRLGIEQHTLLETLPVARARELISAHMLTRNASRWYRADERPHITSGDRFDGLDILRADGSIVWSRRHAAGFTQERSRRMALAYAADRRHSPPVIDPKGVRTVDRVFAFLKEANVQVYLAHPPFNPITWAELKDQPYRKGLHAVENLTREFAGRYGFRVVGGFDPTRLGCTERMFIDAEHSNAECLKKIFAEVASVDAGRNSHVPASVATGAQ